MSKRRKGFPSETHVKRGRRFIKGGEMNSPILRRTRPAGAAQDEGLGDCAAVSLDAPPYWQRTWGTPSPPSVIQVSVSGDEDTTLKLRS